MSRTPISGIEVFLAIVREGSLRAAARSLGVGAPAVSHQLKALERRIGVDLLVRTTRSIELTEAGRTLLTGAAPAFQEIIDAVEGTLDVELSEEELAERRKDWKPRETDYQSGALWRYAQTVGDARSGALTHPGAKAETHVYADI